MYEGLKRDNKKENEEKKKNNKKELKDFLLDISVYFKFSFLKNNSDNIYSA